MDKDIVNRVEPEPGLEPKGVDLQGNIRLLNEDELDEVSGGLAKDKSGAGPFDPDVDGPSWDKIFNNTGNAPADPNQAATLK